MPEPTPPSVPSGPEPTAENLGAALRAAREARGLSLREVARQVEQWRSESPIDGVFWLPALDDEGDHRQLDVDGWREALRLRVKDLHAVMRALYDDGPFLVAATRLGGVCSSSVSIWRSWSGPGCCAAFRNARALFGFSAMKCRVRRTIVSVSGASSAVTSLPPRVTGTR